MPSYRTYGLLIVIPYLLLAITFHTHLQSYERTPKIATPNDRITNDDDKDNSAPLKQMDSNLQQKFNLFSFKGEESVGREESLREINPRFLLNNQRQDQSKTIFNAEKPSNNRKNPVDKFQRNRGKALYNNNNHAKSFNDNYKNNKNIDDRFQQGEILASNDIKLDNNNKLLGDFNPLNDDGLAVNHDKSTTSWHSINKKKLRRNHTSAAENTNQSRDELDNMKMGRNGVKSNGGNNPSQVAKQQRGDNLHNNGDHINKRATGYNYKLHPTNGGRVKLPHSNSGVNNNVYKLDNSNSIGKKMGRNGVKRNKNPSQVAIDQERDKSLQPSNKMNGGIIDGKSINLFEMTSAHGSYINLTNATWIKSSTSFNTQEPRWNSNFPIQDHCRLPNSNSAAGDSSSANVHFQPLKGNYIYSAYLDKRESKAPVVRIIALIQSLIRPQFFCHFMKPITAKSSGNSWYGWLRPSNYETRNVQYYEMCENHGKMLGGWILTCEIPNYMADSPPCDFIVSVHSRYDSSDIEGNVNISMFRTKPGINYTITYYTNDTNINNNVFHQKSQNLAPSTSSTNIPPKEKLFFKPKIRINLHRTSSSSPFPSTNPSSSSTKLQHSVVTVDKTKQNFGICVPPLFGYIPSTTLIEFIELSRILGADHILFYIQDVSGEIQRVLKYYKKQGVISVIPWKIPADERSIWYHGQLLAINDCLYRSMHRFKYVAFNDLDEFIVPKQPGITNWLDMIAGFHAADPSSQTLYSGYSFQSAFFDPLSSSARMLYDLESDLRTKAFTKVRSKVMVMPDRMYELGIHHISRPIHVGLQIYYVNTSEAYIHHYRQCVTDFDPRMNCQIYARDESLSHYIPTLRHNVHKTTWVLKELESKYEQMQRINEKPGSVHVRNI